MAWREITERQERGNRDLKEKKSYPNLDRDSFFLKKKL